MINMRDIYTNWDDYYPKNNEYYIIDSVLLGQMLELNSPSEVNLAYSNLGVCKLFKDIKYEINKYNHINISNMYEPELQADTLEISNNLCKILSYLDYFKFNKNQDSEKIIKCIVSYSLRFILDFVSRYKIICKYYFNIFNLYQLFQSFLFYIVEEYKEFELVEYYSETILKLVEMLEDMKIGTNNYTICLIFKSSLIEMRDELLK